MYWLLASHITTKRPLWGSCLPSWSNSLTLRKFPCYNMQVQRFKSTNAWTINYLHLLAELGHIRDSLIKNKSGIYWASNKIIYCLFQSNISNVALSICKRFIRNQVLHNKLIVNTLHVFLFFFFVFTINVQIL